MSFQIHGSGKNNKKKPNAEVEDEGHSKYMWIGQQGSQ